MDGTYEFEFPIYLTRGPVPEGPKSKSHQAKERSYERSHRGDGAFFPVTTGISPAARNAESFHQTHKARRSAPHRCQQSEGKISGVPARQVQDGGKNRLPGTIWKIIG